MSAAGGESAPFTIDPGREAPAKGAIPLLVVLLAVGAFAWWLQLRAPLEADPRALGSLPMMIEGWEGQDLPLEQAVEAQLDADFHLQRAYVHPSGEVIWLYVGYYGTARGGRPEHTPRGCYVGAGWGIERARVLVADPATGLHVNEYEVARGNERQLVHFWYRSTRRTGLLGGIDQNLDRLRGRLFDGRADGALVRLSAETTGEDEVIVRGRLLAFAAKLDALLGTRWPVEFPAGSRHASAEAR